MRNRFRILDVEAPLKDTKGLWTPTSQRLRNGYPEGLATIKLSWHPEISTAKQRVNATQIAYASSNIDGDLQTLKQARHDLHEAYDRIKAEELEKKVARVKTFTCR